jgi:3-dehydroquinate dehydratase
LEDEDLEDGDLDLEDGDLEDEDLIKLARMAQEENDELQMLAHVANFQNICREPLSGRGM